MTEEHKFKDYLEVEKDPQFETLIRRITKGQFENVVFSSRILKLSSKGMPLLRVLIITEKAVYNVPVSDYTILKRRIPLDLITSATASKISSEVVLHVPEEYDFRFQVFDKAEVFQALSFLKNKEFQVKWVYDIFLGSHTRSREAVLNLPPSQRPHADPAAERKQQYINKKKSKDFSNDDEDNEHENDTDDNYMELNENAEEFGNEDGRAPLKVNMSDFELIRVLGRGAFGKVLLVKKKDTGVNFAMKILKKNMVFKRKQVAHTMTERKIMEAARHPFCMGLRYAFQSDSKLYIVMDFAKGGELYYHLKKQKSKRFEEAAAKIILAEVALGIGHLHSKGIIYRDLKPENVLLHEDGHICLADFGLAKELNPGNTDTKTMCGTPEYLAPEVLGGKRHNQAIDWWAYGCLVYELLTGVTPFHSKTMEELIKKVERGKVRFPPYMSAALQDLIMKLLTANPKARLGCGENGVEELKEHAWFADIDWKKLVHKKITPIYLPSDGDNFDTKFLEEEAIDSVVPESALHGVNQAEFDGFSFAQNDLKSH